MQANNFRKELKKLLPGLKWTVHNKWSTETLLTATGIVSKGLNRMFTLRVTRRERKGRKVEYEVKSSGFGARAPWLAENTDGTLARAVRGLQNYYESMAVEYGTHEDRLNSARKKQEG
ncbi:MAG TPA: hypothetical protein DD405_07170 [Desulfobacteraceae bacterium]|nr:hypothetical protein [Desulfobacteraceae bacterium]